MATMYKPIQRSTLSMRTKVVMKLWVITRALLFRPTPSLLRGYRRALLKIFGAKLANGVSIHQSAVIDYPWNLTMEANSSVGEHAWIYAMDEIHIGSNSCIGQHARILTGSHDISDPTFRLITKPVTIGDGCWIAVGATILPGVQIGSMSVVGAGGVVTRNVGDSMIVGGNPAQFLKHRILNQHDQPDRLKSNGNH